MIISRATIETEHASRYLQQLCKHWAHKFAVEFTPAHGTITLPGGATVLDAGEGGLDVELTTEDDLAAERLEGVVADHIKRFAFREDLVFVWRRSPA